MMHHPDADAPMLNPLPLPTLVIFPTLPMGLIEGAFQLGESVLIGGSQRPGLRQEIAPRHSLFNAIAWQTYTRQSFPPDRLMWLVT
ncbi:MAG: hypothetical protein GDA53_10635 [Rhodobacteraceae bacterium]|nr:hypothetical protein [Paracoccaceae bacterium]